MKLKNRKILTINSGSSSIKFALFDADANFKKELYGKIDRIGVSDAALTYHDVVTDKPGKHIEQLQSLLGCSFPVIPSSQQKPLPFAVPLFHPLWHSSLQK